jgi:peptidoglycan/LPS O-acetylase OafA/YrhL
LVSLVFRAEWANPASKSTLPEYLVAFSPGLAMAVFEQLWIERDRSKERFRGLAPILLGLAALAALWHAYSRPNSVGDAVVAQTLSGTLVGGFVVAAALLHEWTEGRALRPFAHPAAVWIGRRSYGIYLLHFLIVLNVVSVGDDVNSVGLSFALRIAVCAALSILAAAVLFQLVERPAMRLRGRGPVRETSPTQPEMLAP